MTEWVALLRGVNVGGITVRSADLAALFRESEYTAVKTVLASGNVRFTADAGTKARAELKARIEQALRDRFGYDAWIVLVTLDELAAAIDAFPFDAGDASRHPYVIFCSDDAVRGELVEAAASVDPVEDPVQDGHGDGVGFIYWSPEKGRTLDTGYAKVLGKAKYKATTTTRNLRTLAKIVGASP
ncbi:MAG: DUF1697 domain-containing protein [Microbacterium sp.]